MLDALKTAGYFSREYQLAYGKEIDEMKLHKLLYFFLRECYIENEKSVIAIPFEARKFGPISTEVRHAYKKGVLTAYPSAKDLSIYQEILDHVFFKYAYKSSWSLSSITHGEISWMNAIKRQQSGGDASIRKEDILRDASRQRIRRYVLADNNE